MIKQLSAFFILFLMLCMSFYTNAQTEFRTDDYIYKPSIKTVLLHPNTGTPDGTLLPAIASLTKGPQLILEFDELGSQYINYYVKLVSCNSDWSVSTLSSMQFVADYNEYYINDRNISNGTITPYVHYRFIIPPLLTSGNFIVKVYNDGNEDDLILTKRFIIYENVTTLIPDVKWSRLVSTQRTHQQVDFTLNYGGFDIVNPFQNVKIVLRQNFRFDNAITDLKPVYYGDDQSSMQYIYFNNENAFPAGFEFRRFEGQSTYSPMFNVAKINRSNSRIDMYLYNDESTNTSVYTFWKDVNGWYMPYHYENQGFTVEPDYLYVHFYLLTPPVPGKVYAIGAMSGWKLSPEFAMQYDATSKTYGCTALLKQGYYNYRYVFIPDNTKIPDETYFEGSFSSTENFYDIIAYYRGPGDRHDRVIGYASVDFQKQ